MIERPIRVLIADDQDDVRSAFRLILNAQPDITVIGEAADGTAAAELAHQLQPDVVSADLFITPGTAKNHVANIQRKLDVRNRVAIALTEHSPLPAFSGLSVVIRAGKPR